MADSEILPIREALTKLDELEPGTVPKTIWARLEDLENETYMLWLTYLMGKIEVMQNQSQNRQQIRDYLKELTKKNGGS